MRYAAFSLAGDAARRLGVVHGDRIVDVPGVASLLELIQQGPDAWRRVSDTLRATLAKNGNDGHALKDVRLHAPIPRPARNIVCLGLNYVAHMKESAQARGREAKIPEHPIFFTKLPTTVNGPYDAIPLHSGVTQQIDWEAELGVVIGTGGTNITRSEALAHVFGYTVINDVSARDLQFNHMQWFKGKTLDGFCPMGPFVVTSDEFGNPQGKAIACRVNGVVKQNANTADMIFPVDAIIESLSQGVTLEAGDIIATGTPEGVGIGRTPKEFLQSGDIVETEIEGIGTLRNTVGA